MFWIKRKIYRTNGEMFWVKREIPWPEREASGKRRKIRGYRLDIQKSHINMVRLAGLEPAHPAPEAGALSPEL